LSVFDSSDAVGIADCEEVLGCWLASVC